MEMTYRLLNEYEVCDLYACLKAEDILWALFPDVPDMSEDQFLADMQRDDVYALGGFIDGYLAGCLTVRPFDGANTQCAEVGVTALRRYFPVAAPLCRGALIKASDDLRPASFIGRVAAPNIHVLRMLSRVGFKKLCRIPGLVYYDRKNQHVDGYLVLATPESVRLSEGA